MKTTPTISQKIEKYESFFHRINSFMVSGEYNGITELIQNADNLSYAHRVGNGELSDEEQQQRIDDAFWKLSDTPKTDLLVKERQRKYETSQRLSRRVE